jgi:fructose/tagatose bisphosphate aldolase
MAFARAVNDYWQKNSDSITTNLEKKRFDPRVWLKIGEQEMQKECEMMMEDSGSANKTVF